MVEGPGGGMPINEWTKMVQDLQIAQAMVDILLNITNLHSWKDACSMLVKVATCYFYGIPIIYISFIIIWVGAANPPIYSIYYPEDQSDLSKVT